MPLLIILFLFFVMPWFALFLAVLIALFFLILIPLGFAGRSFYWLLIGPMELFKTFFNKKVRRNHALEHATISVLEKVTGYTHFEGMAYENGFTVRGAVRPELILSSAREALGELQRGNHDLAIHPKCGTTIIVVNTFSSIVFIAFLIVIGNLTFLSVILALLLGHLVGPLTGKLVQRYITTSVDLENLEIAGVEVRSSTRNLGNIILQGPGDVMVHTRDTQEVLIPEIIG
ncbi:MAG: hypothetical protein JW971_01915 [Synergistales bacterium]|nr:hypothetical protein [Synergistales bacterium]